MAALSGSWNAVFLTDLCDNWIVYYVNVIDDVFYRYEKSMTRLEALGTIRGLYKELLEELEERGVPIPEAFSGAGRIDDATGPPGGGATGPDVGTSSTGAAPPGASDGAVPGGVLGSAGLSAGASRSSRSTSRKGAKRMTAGPPSEVSPAGEAVFIPPISWAGDSELISVLSREEINQLVFARAVEFSQPGWVYTRDFNPAAFCA